MIDLVVRICSKYKAVRSVRKAAHAELAKLYKAGQVSRNITWRSGLVSAVGFKNLPCTEVNFYISISRFPMSQITIVLRIAVSQ